MKKIAPLYLVIVSCVSVFFISCSSSDKSNYPNAPVVSPLIYSTVWNGALVWNEDSNTTREENISIVLTPSEKLGLVKVYTFSKENIIYKIENGKPYKEYELTFQANGFFTCRIYKTNKDGSYRTLFREDEGYYYCSGNSIHFMSKYLYKNSTYAYLVNGFWSIVECSPTRLRLKHQDTLGTMDLHPLK